MRSVREGFHRLGIGLVAVVWLLWAALMLFLGTSMNAQGFATVTFAAAAVSLLVYAAMLLLAWIIDGFRGAAPPRPIASEPPAALPPRSYAPGAFRKAAILGAIVAAINIVANPNHDLRLALTYGGPDLWIMGITETLTPALLFMALVGIFGRRRRPATPEIIPPIHRIEPPLR